LFSGVKINFINTDKGWVIGDAGDIHITTNGGMNWNYFSMGLSIQTNSINFSDENTGYEIGNNGKIWKSNNGGFIWTQMSKSITISNLYEVSFINTLTGFAAGSNGKLLKTTNSGNNWITSATFSNWDLGHFKFVNENTGYLAADSLIWKGKLYKTIDAGNSWSSVFNISNYYITSEFFIDPENGYLSANRYNRDTSKIFKTTNGGSEWQEVYNLSSTGMKGLCFINSTTGFCSADNGSIYKTTDNGFSWAQDVSTHANSFYFTSPQTGYAVGINGSAYKTTNSGDNWSILNTGVSAAYYMTKLYFTNNNTGFAIGNTVNSPIVSVIIRTTDGGNMWTILDSNHFGGLYGITFSNSSLGYIVGSNGTILHTTNGGLTFSGETEEVLPQFFQLYQNYPNPFNPVTHLRFGISNLGFVSLKVYNVIGKEIAVLVNEKKNPGSYEVEFDGSDLSSGIYFYSFYIDGKIMQTRKMLIVK